MLSTADDSCDLVWDETSVIVAKVILVFVSPADPVDPVKRLASSIAYK